MYSPGLTAFALNRRTKLALWSDPAHQRKLVNQTQLSSRHQTCKDRSTGMTAALKSFDHLTPESPFKASPLITSFSADANMQDPSES